MAHSCPNHDDIPAFGLRACYECLKSRFRGEDLSDEELDFIGWRPNGHKPAGGWHDPGNLGSYELDDGLSAEDSAMLSALMNVPRQDQLDFVNADWF